MSITCPLCDSRDVQVFVERQGVPVHQNLPRPTEQAAKSVPRGDLRLAACGTCGFIHNSAFDATLTEYGESYDNDQNYSPTFEGHVEGLISGLVQSGVARKQVVEVGCGKGTFLRQLCAAGDNRGIGFDPSYIGPPSIDGERVAFVRAFYGSEHRSMAADAVVCRHVIEHVARPLVLLEAIRDALSHSATLHFETPDVGWILQNTVIQDFFYEHCSYFTPASLEFAFAKVGFEATSLRHVFGHQYMWLDAKFDPARAAPPPTAATGGQTVQAALGYRAREATRLARLAEKLKSMRSGGRIAIWGAGAKGVTFLNLLDPQRAIVDFVVDINPRKHHLFVPCTAHPIVAPSGLFGSGVTDVIVMNGNYVGEIRVTITDPSIRVHNEAEL